MRARSTWSLAGGQRGTDEWPEVQAANAVLRIRHASTTSLKGDASTALRWPPARLHVLRALIGYGDAGLEALRKLIVRRDLVLDDQMIAQVLVHVTDFEVAKVLVRADTAKLGEASMIAMARRHFERGELDAASKILSAIRPLSRFRDQAISMQAEIHMRRGQRDQAKELVVQICDPDLAAHWAFDVSGVLGGHREVLAHLQRQNTPPSSVMVGRLIEAAWKAQDLPTLESVMRLLLHYGRAPGADSATYFELAKGLNSMLKALGCDVPAILRDEEEVQKGVANLMAGGFGI